MENATKALLIAAGVLIGVMILSLGVALYYSLNGYIEETQEQMEINSLNKFNTQFLNYINVTPDESGNYRRDSEGNIILDFELTVQDIVTVANIAYENNKNYNLSDSLTDVEYTQLVSNENNLYVTVNAELYRIDEYGQEVSERKTNLEKKINEDEAEVLSRYISNHKYVCSSVDIKISPVTGRVYEINFN